MFFFDMHDLEQKNAMMKQFVLTISLLSKLAKYNAEYCYSSLKFYLINEHRSLAIIDRLNTWFDTGVSVIVSFIFSGYEGQ